MMRCSFNEVEALLTKAARGNGAQAGQAARFGQAAVMCLCADGDVGAIHAALAALPGGAIAEYAVKIQQELAETDGNRLKMSAQDPLWAGYLTSLPYKSVQVSPTERLIYLDTFERQPKPPRLEVDPKDLAAWRAMAAKTFVPESEQSRIAGAGAGLTDND